MELPRFYTASAYKNPEQLAILTERQRLESGEQNIAGLQSAQSELELQAQKIRKNLEALSPAAGASAAADACVRLEKLIPPGRILRKIDRWIDFSIIHEKTEDLYSSMGRPSN